MIEDPLSIDNLLKDLAGELDAVASSREKIRPLSAQDRAQVCKCGHYLRYHTLTGAVAPVCKYNSCKCKGYKQKENKSI